MRQWKQPARYLLLAAVAGCVPKSLDSRTNATPEERAVTGVGVSYQPLSSDSNQLVDALDGDIQKRRDAGWHVLQDVTTPVTLQDPALGSVSVPKLLTWYTASEFARIFKVYYAQLSDAEKASGVLTAEHQDLPAKVLQQEVTDPAVGGWKQDQVDKLIASLKAEAPANPHGFQPEGNLFSPDFIVHLLKNFKKVNDCTQDLLAQFPADKETGDPNNFTPCMNAEFPVNAVMIKPIFTSPGQLPLFDSDAAAIAKGLLDPKRWQSTRNADPAVTADPSRIFTLTSGGTKVVLSGMHVVTKDVRDWLWTTYWWSDAPNTDLGADRPASIAANGAAWGNYKMCAVSNFEEKDLAPGSHYKETHPDLAATLDSIADSMAKFRAAQGGGEDMTAHQWCANPHIEGGFGTPTNCVGCHQHSPGVDGSGIVTRDRKTFPGDFAWSFGGEFRGAITNVISPRPSLPPIPPPGGTTDGGNVSGNPGSGGTTGGADTGVVTGVGIGSTDPQGTVQQGGNGAPGTVADASFGVNPGFSAIP